MLPWKTKLTRVLAILGVLWATFGAGLTVAAAQNPQPSAQEDFRPVKPGELEQEQIPAAPLVFTAYSVIWLALVAYIFVLWRRLTRVERELHEVSAKLHARRP
jgi:CcmD family protein